MALRALQGPTGGGTPVGGGGTSSPSTIPRWTGPSTLGDSIITQTGTSRITVGSGSYAGASLDGVRLVNGVNSYFAASDGTRTVFMGADGNAVVGTLTAHDLKIRAGNADAMIVQQGTLNVGIGTPSPVTGSRVDAAGTSVDQSGWGLIAVRSSDAMGADKGGSISFGGLFNATNETHWAQISGRKENGTSGQYGGYLAFATRTNGVGSNAERMRIDSSGNVGIGTASPGAILHTLGTGTTTGIFATTSANAWVELRRSTSTTLGYIGTGAGLVTGGAAADLAFRCESGNLLFSTGATERARIDSAGNLILNTATTGATIQAAGSQQGLKLPATPGNADTQTLDCYAEGTWTPTLAGFGGTNPTVTASYTRVGRLVTIAVTLTATGGNQYSGALGSTTLTLPSTMTPSVTASSTMTNGAVANVGNVAAFSDGFIYLPTFGLTTSTHQFTITYRV